MDETKKYSQYNIRLVLIITPGVITSGKQATTIYLSFLCILYRPKPKTIVRKIIVKGRCKKSRVQLNKK